MSNTKVQHKAWYDIFMCSCFIDHQHIIVASKLASKELAYSIDDDDDDWMSATQFCEGGKGMEWKGQNT